MGFLVCYQGKHGWDIIFKLRAKHTYSLLGNLLGKPRYDHVTSTQTGLHVSTSLPTLWSRAYPLFSCAIPLKQFSCYSHTPISLSDKHTSSVCILPHLNISFLHLCAHSSTCVFSFTELDVPILSIILPDSAIPFAHISHQSRVMSLYGPYILNLSLSIIVFLFHCRHFLIWQGYQRQAKAGPLSTSFVRA